MSERLHIALFIYSLQGGGAQRRTVTLANGFATRGHRVDLVVISSDESRNVTLQPGVRVVALDAGWRHWFEPLNRYVNVRGVFTAGAMLVLARYLRRERPDVLLSAASHVNLVALLARRLAATRVPLVLRVSNHPSGNLAHHPFLQRMIRRFLRWAAGRIYRWADAAIAVSHGVAWELRKLTWMPPERTTTIYNPVVTPELEREAQEPVDHPWFAPGSPPVILGVGKLKVQKDFAALLRAFARVRAARPARLVILGEGAERGHLERLAAHLGVQADVALPGFVPNPFAWMSKAAVFVLSSAWEGLPGALIEAMACGCPVVSTDCPSGPAEILERGVFGPLVPVGDDQALADAIVSVLDAPPDPQRLRVRAAQFSAEQAADRYLAVLRAVVEVRRFSAAAKLDVTKV